MGRRLFLFVLTNILVVITISLVTRLLGIQPYLSERGINYEMLLTFCTLWGFGGAFISLLLSRIMAKLAMRVQVLDPDEPHPELRWLVNRVHEFAHDAGIKKMPEVGIYQSDELNAFATGPTRNRALVAVSSGLLRSMNHEEVEGVLAHEVAHIANGDMVTMTLIQGVVNAFVMFFARVIAIGLSQFVRDDMRIMVQFMATIIFEIALSILGMFVVAYFSRRREFRADADGAELAGNRKMIEALRALKIHYHPEKIREDSFATLRISGKTSGLLALLASHPPLEARIQRLQNQARAAA